MIELFLAPSATSTFAAASVWSIPLFNELLPIAYITIGVLAAGYLVSAIISFITGAFQSLAIWEQRDYRRYDKE